MATVVVTSYHQMLIITASLLGFLAIFPFGPYQATLLLARALRLHQPSRNEGLAGEHDLTFAILLCAYNEEAVIRQKIDNLLALRSRTEDLEILIYIDGAGDRTAQIVSSYGRAITLVQSPERKGKSWGMSRLVAMTDADIILFTDANVIVDIEAITKLRKHFNDHTVGCVTSHLRYTNPGETPTSSIGSYYWLLDDRTKELETDTGSAMGADGSLFAVRRDLYYPSPSHLPDDFYVSMRVLCGGHRVVRARDVIAYEPHTTDAVDEYHRKVRIACQAVGVHRLLWPELRGLSPWNLYKYVAHKVLRWVSGFLLLASLLLSALGLAVSFGWSVAIGFVVGLAMAIAVGSALRIRAIEQLVNIAIALAASATGVYRGYRGVAVVTWDPASSAHKAIPAGNPLP